jgi:hypothetical protein
MDICRLSENTTDFIFISFVSQVLSKHHDQTAQLYVQHFLLLPEVAENDATILPNQTHLGYWLMLGTAFLALVPLSFY